MQLAVGLALRSVTAILAELAASLHSLRAKLREELHVALALWSSREEGAPKLKDARTALAPALRPEALEAEKVEKAVRAAEVLGMKLQGTATEELLQRLQHEEDFEGVWHCLTSALSSSDHVGLSFWLEEAEKHKALAVPPEVRTVLELMDLRETSLKEASFRALVSEAYGRRDHEELTRLVGLAQGQGVDSATAEAALAALSSEPEANGGDDKAAPAVLYVSSPNGQTGCFGMYEIVKDELANGLPVWRQLGGERWIYTDLVGRWSIGSSKVKEKSFQCNSGFIVTEKPHAGVMPHQMLSVKWVRFDEEKKAWRKDEDITIASEYVEEELFPRRKQQAKGRGRGRSKAAAGRGRGGRKRDAKQQAKQDAKQAEEKPEVKSETPASASTSEASRATSSRPQLPLFPPLPREVGRLSRTAALHCLGFGVAAHPTLEELRKAYRQQALQWHPDRLANHGQEQSAKHRFQELRDAFEHLQALLRPELFMRLGDVGKS